jgi:hypothetical protein
MKAITKTDLMVSVSAGLVAIDEESNVARLVHYTAQEYFNRTRTEWFPNAQTDITKTCVTYLSFDAFKTGPSQKAMQPNGLYRYAAENWGHHARVSLIEGQKLILDFLESTTKVSACSLAMISTGYWYTGETQMTGIHLAAYFGLWKSMSALLERLHGVDPEDKGGRTPLSWAAGNGHEVAVKLLLDRGANIESKDNDRQTPLLRVADNGNKAVAKLLLDRGANIESKDDKLGQTPLLWAASNGHEAVVKLLLDRGAAIESKSKSGQTPLSWAT